MKMHAAGRSLRWASLALALVCGEGLPLAGQGVTYVTVSKPEMGGAMGMVARMAPGAVAETRVTTTVQGTFIRTDEADRTSTILDWAEGRYTFLNHEDRSWYALTLDEMMARAASMGGGAMTDQPGSLPDIEVERTGRTRDFDGYSAEQVLMFVIPPPADLETPSEGPPAMAILVDIWISKDFPGHEAFAKVQETMAAQAGSGMAGALAMDPAMVAAGQRIAEQMKGLQGVPVRTVTSMVMVPPGGTLDREALLAAADQPVASSGGTGAAVSAADAARQALGGVLGRRRQQQAAPEELAGPEGPSVFMRTTQTIEEVREGAVPADRFQVPAGYREVPPVR